jgi:hypothetical protein
MAAESEADYTVSLVEIVPLEGKCLKLAMSFLAQVLFKYFLTGDSTRKYESMPTSNASISAVVVGSTPLFLSTKKGCCHK